MPIDLSLELRLSYLRAAQAAQEEIEDAIVTYREFYDGDQNIKLTDRQKEYLKSEFDSFGNICKRVVGVAGDRLAVDQIAPDGDESQAYSDLATDWWASNNLASIQKDVYRSSLRDGNVALIVGWNETRQQPTFTPNLVYDGATGLVRFHYDTDDNLLFASKRWTVWDALNPSETGKRRLTVYRPGAIERYEANLSHGGSWRFLAPEEIGIPNPQPWTDNGTFSGEPLGIPVIPFENPTGSELEDVLVIQELLNHNISTFDISIDYHGHPLLWMAGASLPINSGTGKAEVPDFGPGQAILLPSDGTIGRVEAADLVTLYQGGVISIVQLLALVKGWPLFIFDRGQQAPSGVALQVMEGSLVKQVEDKQRVYGGAWAKAFDIGRKLHRLQTGQELPGEIKFIWESAQTNDELAHIEALEKKFMAGEVPIIQRWRELGYSQDDINQMLTDKQQEDDLGIGAFIPAVTQ